MAIDYKKHIIGLSITLSVVAVGVGLNCLPAEATQAGRHGTYGGWEITENCVLRGYDTAGQIFVTYAIKNIHRARSASSPVGERSDGKSYVQLFFTAGARDENGANDSIIVDLAQRAMLMRHLSNCQGK